MGDYCDIIGCKSTLEYLDEERKSSLCSDSLMQQTRYECYGYFKSCFPSPQSPRDKQILEYFQEIYCNRFYCLHENNIEMSWDNISDVWLFV